MTAYPSRTRERMLAEGCTIDAILPAREAVGVCPDLPLDYADNVIGGRGSFVIAPDRRDGYEAALRREPMLGIGGLDPQGDRG